MITDGSQSLPGLERALFSIATAPGASEALERLLAEAQRLAPRVALLLVRQGEIRGWRAAGHEPEAARRLQQLRVPLGQGWLGRAAAQDRLDLVERLAGDDAAEVCAEKGVAAAAIPLRVGGSVVCLLVVERVAGEEPWDPHALRVLALFCELRLEIELLRRRMGPAPEVAEPRPSIVAASPVLPAPPPPAPARLVPAVDATGLTPLPEAGTGAEPPKLRDARRFARLIATDIRLYNEEAVLAGRRQRDLSRRLADQIERGRESFQRRFPDLGAEGLALLEEAYVEVLGGGDPATLAL